MNLLKKYLIAGFIFIGIFLLKSQGNLPYYDDRPYNFGFFVGLNTMDFGVELSNPEMDVAEVSSLMPGFTAGIIGNLQLSRYFSLRFSPSINFTERSLTYRLAGETTTVQENVFSIPLMLPLHIKYSAERLHNFRPYLLVGGGAYFDFGRDMERNVLLRPFDYYVEFGTGCGIYFPFFKFSPELKFAIGFNNMLTPTADRVTGTFDAKYTNALSRLTTKMITLSFNFE
jgi:hypothetical protein